MLSGHNGIKLEIKNRKTAGKSQHNQRFNNTLLNNTWVKEVSKIFSKYFEENESTTYQNL